jgi:hypothetical protein
LTLIPSTPEQNLKAANSVLMAIESSTRIMADERRRHDDSMKQMQT